MGRTRARMLFCRLIGVALGASIIQAANAAIIPAPAPGLHRNIPAETYHRWDAVNSSRLFLLHEESPADMVEAITYPPKPTEAKILGSAIHVAILQPHLFESTYIVAGQCSASTGKGERCTNPGKVRRGEKWYCRTKSHDPLAGAAAPESRIIISQDDYDLCRHMRDGIAAHPLVESAMGCEPEDVEVSMVVVDDLGLIRKTRDDILRPDLQTIFDLKSTDSVKRDDFKWSARKYRYAAQGANYLDVANRLGLNYTKFSIIAYRKQRPFIPVIYDIPLDDLICAHKENVEGLKLYKKCRDMNFWPGHGWDYGDALTGREAGYVVNEL